MGSPDENVNYNFLIMADFDDAVQLCTDLQNLILTNKADSGENRLRRRILSQLIDQFQTTIRYDPKILQLVKDYLRLDGWSETI